MQKMTSAYANKKLKSLEEDKAFWVNKEATSCTYIAAINEEPVIPEYDYLEVAQIIEDIDAKIAVLKHAINLNNAMAKVPVGDEKMSIDTILVKMAQLNKRKNILDMMRKHPSGDGMPKLCFMLSFGDLPLSCPMTVTGIP